MILQRLKFQVMLSANKEMEEKVTLDALSASDLLLEQQEQREREQQGKSGLNQIKK